MGGSQTITDKRAALIVGAGDGLGSSICKAFAREGLEVCFTRRARNEQKLATLASEIEAEGGCAHGFGVDAREEDDMIALFDQIERDIGPLDVVVFNIGANVPFKITDTTSRVYRKVWEMAAFAGFLTGREAAKRMMPRGHGSILFTGATASLRGAAGFSAFAGAKHALRALAQSMARELGGEGIHVGHIIVDGLMDGTFARTNFPDVADRVEREEILSPDAVAAEYVHLWKQPRSAWTHELDLRPWKEKF
ncbi:SDR family NAD(P)-dependent oxidoreductase [Pontixanthobacter gangjinensis]